MQANVDTARQVRCAACGRAFKWKPELSGRTMRCPCGTAVLVPARDAAKSGLDGDDDRGEYDFAEPAAPPPRKPATTLASAAAATVGLAAAAARSADAPPPSPSVATGAAAPITVDLPPQRKRLKQEPRVEVEDIAPPSTLRDIILPSLLIPVGIALRVIEVTVATGEPASGVAGVAAAVALNLALSVGLMLGGMFLAVQVMEVCFVGSLARTAYKLVAIAIAPGALYGILTFFGGPTYGSMIGTFASVAAFGVLFWLLMRLDVKDTGICVLVTWILITAANYAAYRAEGMLRDSWL